MAKISTVIPNMSKTTTLVNPSRWDEDRNAEYEEQAAQEEYEQKIRDEYKTEMVEDVLEEHGEEYTVWVSTNTPDIQSQIGIVARSLGKLVKTISNDNQLSSQPLVMSEIERLQLIAILEAVLAELKAPLIDRGRINGIKKALKKGAEKAVSNKASELVQAGLSEAQEAVVGLYQKLLDAPSFSDLWP